MVWLVWHAASRSERVTMSLLAFCQQKIFDSSLNQAVAPPSCMLRY